MKRLASILLIFVLMIGMTACNDKQCTEHVDSDGDKMCDACGTPVEELLPPGCEHKDEDGDGMCDLCTDEIVTRADMIRGDINIMSFNILCELWNNAPSVESRVDVNIAQIHAYMPHVVGLQEVSAKTYEIWAEELENCGSPYKFVDNTADVAIGSEQKVNYSGMLYNSDAVSVVASGTHAYSNSDAANCRVIAWAKFKINATGNNFYVFNTHWNLTESTRVPQGGELADFIESTVGANGDAPVFATGDFNAERSSESYRGFLNRGFTDSSDVAGALGLLTRTYNPWDNGTPIGEFAVLESDEIAFGEAIDHIAYKGDISVDYFTVVSTRAGWTSSDHSPIFASFGFV